MKTSKWSAVLAGPLVFALILTGCTKSSSPNTTSTLTFDAFEPYSGAESVFGPENQAGCLTAVVVINQAGGILGHPVTCTSTDSRSDAADAVPAAQQLIATTHDLVGIVGPSTNEAPSTVSLFDKQHIPMIAQTGDPAFDKTNYAYFYRPTPGDDVNGFAMAVWAYSQLGYTRAATVFGNDVAGQGVVPHLVQGFTKLGGTVVVNEKLALDQSSYRTEIERLVAADPQVIFTELDPQTAATFFGELQQLHGLYPVVGDGGTIGYPAWVQAVGHAIGATNMGKYYSGVQILNPSGGPAWSVYQTALLKTSVANPSQYAQDPYTQTDYDGVIEMALAMWASNNTDPIVFNPYILKITSPSPGAVVVHTYAEGVQAIKAGKTIQYVGSAGPTLYNQFHNAPMPWEADTADASLNVTRRGVVSATSVAALGGLGG
jgi:Periplasmic binding protein